jgi:hypothetical protein
MSSWWNSLETMSSVNTTLKWILAITAILAAIFGVMALVTDNRVNQLKTQRDEQTQEQNKAREEELRQRLENAEKEAADSKIELREYKSGRTLTPEVRQKLIGLLQQAPKGSIEIICAIGDSEACTFANEFKRLLVEVGWTAQVTMAGLSRRLVGLMLVAAQPDSPPHFNALYHALKSVGLSAEASLDIEMKEEARLLVGRRA